ncbi:hypothetical protein TTHERM_00530070 (macronuclear) [Tetrahymena thermophila SB210]|uniref:Uncharacterized protein n=1 Tax=Tetrahymena thermophila (strain SB210) TaxID=312017 RepID=I7LZW8_TETTS|nr:hypothetical protein TTHERM_00530070 [Tetrahymena thermophila SB210]EAR85055.2 hypothetical protein TTHERM_00530070 [Tetrahymena thermophila SB210]|eukprot:XP_001032718.2 hypothetical protein TTHERM_00530070 [Tetrahymena thermophila SB210]
MSQQNLRSQQSFDTNSNLSHVKKLLDPNSYRNYLNQQNSVRQFQKTSHSVFHKPGGFEDINFNVSPLDMPRQPVYGDLNFISRNFGNLCDRQFREQTKSSQKQKFGNRDKEQALKNLSSQQESLKKIKQNAKSTSNANDYKQRPLKDPALNDKRTFIKKVLDYNGMKIVVMFKSFEIEAVKKGFNDIAQRKKKISTMILFEDLQYLIENFHPDEINDLFKKCIYVQNNQIVIDYTKFASLPSKKPTGSILDKASSFPQQQDYIQEDASQNENNEGGYSGKYTLKVQYPFIEMYVSELAHKQIYQTKKRDMLDLFKTDYESLKEYLRHFDSTKAKQVELQIKSNSRSFHSEDQTIQKGEIRKQESQKIEKDQKHQDQKKQIIQNLHIQLESNENKQDQQMKQFQETLNERLKTISEQQQRTQEDEEDVEESRQIIQQINNKNGFNDTPKDNQQHENQFNGNYEDKQKFQEEKIDQTQQNYYLNEQQNQNNKKDQINRFEDITEELENSQQTLSKHLDDRHQNQELQQNGTIDEHQESLQYSENQQQYEESQQNYEKNQQYQEEYQEDEEFQNQGNEDSQFNQNEGQQFQEEENSQQYQGQEEEEQYLRQAEQDEYQLQEGVEYENQEEQQYLDQEYERQFQEQEEGQEQSQLEQYDQSQQEQQQMDFPQFSIEDTEREFDPQILQENIIAQSIVWNDVGYVIGFKSLEISIESNSFEGKIVKNLSFLELYILLIETKESIVEEYIQEKIQISENLEIILDLPQLDFDFQECFALEEGHFYKFLDELNAFEINMEDQAYLIQFNKPSVEIQDEQGAESRQIEIDGQTLQNIVQRGFHFDFVVPQ